MRQRLLTRTHWALLAAIAAGCNDGSSPSGASVAGSGAQNPDAGMSDGQYKSSGHEMTLADPEAALAAIPKEMQPEELMPALKKKLLVPDVKKQGRAMFTHIVTLKAGADVTFCTYLPGATDKVIYIHDTAGSQTNMGHHAILQFTTTPFEPGTRECDPESLEAQQNQVLGGTGGEGNGAIKVPNNVVTEIPVGSQFIINHHWINSSDTDVEAQAEMVTIPPDSQDNLIIARAVAMADTSFKLPPKQQTQHSVTCMFNKDVSLLSMIGHQHSWGPHVRAERAGGRDEIIFDHDYDEAMISHPLTKDFPLDSLYQFKAGEGVKMTCTWDNTTSQMLGFPREMCVFFGWQIGADADIRCLDGSWL